MNKKISRISLVLYGGIICVLVDQTKMRLKMRWCHELGYLAICFVDIGWRINGKHLLLIDCDRQNVGDRVGRLSSGRSGLAGPILILGHDGLLIYYSIFTILVLHDLWVSVLSASHDLSAYDWFVLLIACLVCPADLITSLLGRLLAHHWKRNRKCILSLIRNSILFSRYIYQELWSVHAHHILYRCDWMTYNQIVKKISTSQRLPKLAELERMARMNSSTRCCLSRPWSNG